MFKRVQKRQRRKQKEEELGLNEDMKEVLGLQDTDSEESESSSEEDGHGSDEERIESGETQEEGSVDEEDGGSDALEGELEDEDDASEEDEEDDSISPISVTEAVRDPVYIVSLDPEVKACILCPGKLLKNLRMAEIHKASKVCTSAVSSNQSITIAVLCFHFILRVSLCVQAVDRS